MTKFKSHDVPHVENKQRKISISDFSLPPKAAKHYSQPTDVQNGLNISEENTPKGLITRKDIPILPKKLNKIKIPDYNCRDLNEILEKAD